MTDLAALDMRYRGRMRIVSSRKAVVIELETDIVNIQRVLDALPLPPDGDEYSVAIARLNPEATTAGDTTREALPSPATPDAASPSPASPKPARVHEKWEQMRPSKQAALRCREPRFQSWLAGGTNTVGSESPDYFDAILKAHLGIDSKRELDTDGAAKQRWLGMDQRYREHITSQDYGDAAQRYG